MVAILVFWLCLCGGVAAIARAKGRSGLGFFVVSVLLSPLVGLIIVLFARNASQLVRDGEEVEGLRKCPYCAEPIRSEAVKCKHCGSAVEPVQHDISRWAMSKEEYNRRNGITEDIS